MPEYCIENLERLGSDATPADVLGQAEKRVGSILLDSASQGYGFGRFSIFACFPRKEIAAHGDRIEVTVSAKGGGSDSRLFAAIKSDIRAAFYGEDSQWKADIWARGQQIVEQALAGVNG